MLPEPMLAGPVETVMSWVSFSSYQKTTAFHLPVLHIAPSLSPVVMLLANMTHSRGMQALPSNAHASFELLRLPDDCPAAAMWLINSRALICRR